MTPVPSPEDIEQDTQDDEAQSNDDPTVDPTPSPSDDTEGPAMKEEMPVSVYSQRLR